MVHTAFLLDNAELGLLFFYPFNLSEIDTLKMKSLTPILFPSLSPWISIRFLNSN